jgi:RNA polymerase subunit RPABC4/transcription elongation factor Spt4
MTAALDASPFVLVVGSVLAYVAVLWVALTFWMVRDAAARSSSRTLVLVTALLGLLVPFAGFFVYILLRPPLTIEEERALRLEEQALTEAPSEDVRPCPSCGRDIEPEFVVCPYCRTQFARRCRSCQRWLRLGWRLCPYCAADIELQSIEGQGRALTS